MNYSNHTYCQTTLNAALGGTFVGFPSSGKERDHETGLSYFGARYYDADLLMGWLSSDPMADKYPSISPYAYCAWNPVELVDPNGLDTFNINIAEKKNVEDLVFSRNKDSQKNPDVVNIFFNDDLISTYTCKGKVRSNVRPFNFPDHHITEVLFFEQNEDSKAVFNAIMSSNKSEMEFDNYSCSNGLGELYTSGEYDNVCYPKDYKNQSWTSWDHYHPYNAKISKSNINDTPWNPSVSDLKRANKLGLTLTLYYPGGSYTFDKISTKKCDIRTGENIRKQQFEFR